MNRMTNLCAALGCVVLFAAPSQAEITQSIFFSYDDDFDVFNGDIRDGDRIEGQTDADIDRALIAGIGGPSELYRANGSVGIFGSYGLTGELRTQGELHAQVVIEADVTAPPIGVPRQAEALFIIDGGMFNFVSGPASTLDFTLTLSVDHLPVFQSFFTMEGGPGGATQPVTFFGDDIGAVQDANQPWKVEIPLSFQRVDLGVLNPGQSFLFEYQLDIVAEVHDFAEIVAFQFEDPLTINPSPVMPGALLRPSIVFIPEPASLGLLLSASIVALTPRRGALMRRRSS